MPVTHTFTTMTERVSHNYTAHPKSLPAESEVMPTAKATKTPTRVCTTAHITTTQNTVRSLQSMPQFVLVFTRLGRTKTRATLTLLFFIYLFGGGGGGGCRLLLLPLADSFWLLTEYKKITISIGRQALQDDSLISPGCRRKWPINYFRLRLAPTTRTETRLFTLPLVDTGQAG